jgi:predicted transposase YbfD/YdcC
LPAQSATTDARASACSTLINELSAPADAGPLPPQLVCEAVTGLLERFAQIRDHRHPAWVDHPLPAVLALCAGAVVAGMSSFLAITGWVADVPPEVLTCAYAGSPRPVPATGPSKATVWRVLTGLDTDALDAAIGNWLIDRAYADIDQNEPEPVPPPGPEEPEESPASPRDRGGRRLSGVLLAADGKTCRGSKTADRKAVHLLSVMTHEHRLVLAQTEVGAKTNEVPKLKELLTEIVTTIDLRGAALTVDALHCVRSTAKFLHRHEIDYVITVKENTPKLFAALDAMDWKNVPIGHTSIEKAHGRITKRTIQTLPAPPASLPFPHTAQAFLIERTVTDLNGKNLSNVAALGITSIPPDRANPTQVAHYVRDHWSIESMHWIRDFLYREDHSTIRTRSGPRTMAALRNLATGAHRLAGRTDITEATRWAARNMLRPFQILNLDQRS